MNEIMFAQGMMPHHQQAIEMSNMALKNGASSEVKKLAKGIIAAQGKEISQLKYWLTATKSSMTMGHDMGMGGMDHGSMDMSAMDHSAMGPMQSHPDSEKDNPLVDMQSSASEPKLDDPGIGLRDNGRQVLTYGAMRSLFDDPDGREPGRTVELHLTGHMEKFAWSFDGIPFASAEPLRLNYGERMRIVLVNDTMMQHPIHLHGVWSDLEDADGGFHLRKHTIDMPPGTRRSYRVRADALGRWAFHCHLLYHMEAGMMREVRIEA